MFLPTACTVYGKSSVQNEKEMLDAVHADPSTSTRWISYETGLSHTLHEEHLYLFRYSLYKGYSQGTVIFTSSSVSGSLPKLYMNLTFCTMCYGLMRQHSQGVQ